MSENIVLNAGSGGDTTAADDIGGIKYPYVKLAWGTNNSVAVVDDTLPVPVKITGYTSEGLSLFRSIDLDEGTLEIVKASQGTLYGMWVTNRATSTRWIKFYNATSGTYGTGTPLITIGIPGNSTDNVSGQFAIGGHGTNFSTGICVGAGTGVADADTGAPGANDVIINVFYK